MHPPHEHSDDQRQRDRDFANEKRAPEDREEGPDEPGPEGAPEKPRQDKLPGMPDKDDPTPLGDTDQHSPG